MSAWAAAAPMPSAVAAAKRLSLRTFMHTSVSDCALAFMAAQRRCWCSPGPLIGKRVQLPVGLDLLPAVGQTVGFENQEQDDGHADGRLLEINHAVGKLRHDVIDDIGGKYHHLRQQYHENDAKHGAHD